METLSHLIRYLSIIALYVFIYNIYSLMKKESCAMTMDSTDKNMKLKVLKEPQEDTAEEVYELNEPLKIGKDKNNHIVIEGENVADKHAIIFSRGKRAFIHKYKDAGDLYVDGEKIEHLVRLKRGALVEVGGVILQYEE